MLVARKLAARLSAALAGKDEIVGRALVHGVDAERVDQPAVHSAGEDSGEDK